MEDDDVVGRCKEQEANLGFWGVKEPPKLPKEESSSMGQFQTWLGTAQKAAAIRNLASG